MSAVTQNKQTFDFSTVVREHQSGVWRYLRFLGADQTEADDLVQETFLALLRAQENGSFSYQGSEATWGYLRQVARNQLLQRRRKHGREVNTVELTAAETVWCEVASHDGLDCYLQTLRSCLEKLTSRARRAVELQYQQGLGRAELADTLGLSPDGVKTLLRRTRQKLRECIERNIKQSGD